MFSAWTQWVFCSHLWSLVNFWSSPTTIEQGLVPSCPFVPTRLQLETAATENRLEAKLSLLSLPRDSEPEHHLVLEQLRPAEHLGFWSTDNWRRLSWEPEFELGYKIWLFRTNVGVNDRVLVWGSIWISLLKMGLAWISGVLDTECASLFL